MEFRMKVESEIVGDRDMENGVTRIKENHIALAIAAPLKQSMYVDENDRPNNAGARAVRVCLVYGLIANIRWAHRQGFQDMEEHLEEVIKELRENIK